MFTYRFEVQLPPVRVLGDSLDDALRVASEQLIELAGSNEGTMIIANARLRLVSVTKQEDTHADSADSVEGRV